MLLCMKSPTPTVLFGFGEQRIRKSQFVFFHVKILHLKKRSEPQREEEKQENRLFYLLRHTIERLVGGNFELYFVRVALARQTLKHTSDGVTVELTSTRHRQLQIKHL